MTSLAKPDTYNSFWDLTGRIQQDWTFTSRLSAYNNHLSLKHARSPVNDLSKLTFCFINKLRSSQITKQALRLTRQGRVSEKPQRAHGRCRHC